VCNWPCTRDKVRGVLWQPDHNSHLVVFQRLLCLQVFCHTKMPACTLVSWRYFRAASPLGRGTTGLFMGSLNDASPIGICRSDCQRNGSWRSHLKCFRQNGHRFHCSWARRCARKARRSGQVHPRNYHGGTGRATRIAAYRMSLVTCTRGAMHERIMSNMQSKMYGTRCFLFPNSCLSFILLL